jgi:2-phospho-L-lactate/phosphoenolpyruvate guanylyltransferase
MRHSAPIRWLAVVPIKPLSAAKTRLRGAVPDRVHPDLVLAMAQDTVAAALACEAVARVLVVCDDPAVREALAPLGADCVPDRPAKGLNAAVVFGAGRAERWTVALTADLPALRAQELGDALDAARSGRAYVADAEGTGTVLLAAPAGVPLAPRFGPGSAAAHHASGAQRLDGGWPTLRRDVDTAADLDAATKLGLGAHTERMLCAIASTAG